MESQMLEKKTDGTNDSELPSEEFSKSAEMQSTTLSEISDLSCGCEPCPIVLADYFPDADIQPESDEFKNSRCGWHKVAVLSNGMHISPSSETTFWVETRRDLPSDFAEPRGFGAFSVKVADINRLRAFTHGQPATQY